MATIVAGPTHTIGLRVANQPAASGRIPITLNLYNVVNTTGTPQPGSLIRSVTQTFSIPWRPEASLGCGTAWRTAGSNPLSDTAYWNTQTSTNYAHKGAVGTFRQDTGWSSYNGAVAFASAPAPEPGTVGLMVGGGLMILAIRRKKQCKR